jgi:hypothetical protein
MIGNVIQSKFLESLDYPSAAALSFLLMGLILVALLVYARIVGSERTHRMTTVAASPPQVRRSVGARTWAFAKRHALTVYALLVVGYLMLPIAVVILFSFNHPTGPVQLRLERVHVRELAALERRARHPGRDHHVARGRAARDARRDRARDAHGDGDRAAPLRRARRDEPPRVPADVDAGDRPRGLAAHAVPEHDGDLPARASSRSSSRT